MSLTAIKKVGQSHLDRETVSSHQAKDEPTGFASGSSLAYRESNC